MPSPKSLLEPEYADAYGAWKAAPSPESNASMLRTLGPVIEGAARLHTGAVDPITIGHGRRLALEGLRRYDPAKGRLQTHLYNHLQGLKRLSRRQTQALSAPERVVLERHGLEEAGRALESELNREPSDMELMDHLGIAAKRLARLRSYRPGVAEGTMEASATGLYGGADPAGERRSVWQDLVYSELSPIDQRIMEHTLGLHGRQPLENREIARRLRLSPGAISQRKAKIQALLDQEDEISPF